MNLPDSDATETAGAALAAAIQSAAPARVCVWLHGELGAGKTTFCRGLLHALGHNDRVPSPTYTLIEPYECDDYHIYHLDLFRIGDAAELEFLGVDELWEKGSVLLIEWPERADDVLPPADLELTLSLDSRGEQGRELQSKARSEVGVALLKKLSIPF